MIWMKHQPIKMAYNLRQLARPKGLLIRRKKYMKSNTGAAGDHSPGS